MATGPPARPQEQNGWRFFELSWTPEKAGRHRIRCRATDASGNVEPETQQPDRESYVANWIMPTAVRAVLEPARRKMCSGL